MASVNRGVVFQQIDRLYREGTLSGLGDGQLLERYLTHGDEAAFEALVSLHGPMVLGVCRRVLRDPRDIEDAFQATFLVLVRKASTIRDQHHLSNWLFGVAYRVARRARTNVLRRRGREVAFKDQEASAAPETADILGIDSVLDQELNRLPRKYRAPLILCYLKGQTHDQAAEELECPVGTVRSRLARGRDLLRRRLTSRGHAPTAAILGAEAGLPARLLTEAVPPSLISETVEAALGIGASQTIQAGAASASALALTQGVLTTMKLAQLKLLGAAILATSLSAGGVVAVSFAASQNPKEAGSADGVEVNAPKTGKIAEPGTSASLIKLSSVTEKRLRAVEGKLDELLSRSTPKSEVTKNATSAPRDPFRRDPTLPKEDGAARTTVDPQHRSIQELEAELKLAMDNAALREQLFKQAAISTSARDEARGKVLLLKATLEGRFEEVSDEIDRLKLEIKTKGVEREKTNAQTEVATSVVARNNRLITRKPGMLFADDVAKAEWEMKVALAQGAMIEAEIAEIELRAQQLERRRARIAQIIKLAERGERNDESATPAPLNGGSPR